MTVPTRITTPFGAESTAAEVVAGVNLHGKRAVVTGGASGIGLETARALASAGAEVTLAVRNVDAGQKAADAIMASTGNPNVRVAPLDLADQTSIAVLVANWSGPLHILVNNAGIMASPELRTPRGWELQFATNHLGHFALATGLHDALAAAGHARVVVVSSVGHLDGNVVFDDIHFERRPYDPWQAYGQSKTANVLFAVEAARRWAADGITVNALHPGGIRTNLMRYLDAQSVASLTANPPMALKTPEQGASTSVLLAASPLVEGVTGRYFEDNNEAEPAIPGVARGVAPYALDPAAATRPWQVSVDMLAA